MATKIRVRDMSSGSYSTSEEKEYRAHEEPEIFWYEDREGVEVLHFRPTCDHEEYRVEHDSVYFPTQQQIDTNTDHDETIAVAICEDCELELDIEIDYEPDYDDRGDDE